MVPSTGNVKRPRPFLRGLVALSVAITGAAVGIVRAVDPASAASTDPGAVTSFESFNGLPRVQNKLPQSAYASISGDGGVVAFQRTSSTGGFFGVAASAVITSSSVWVRVRTNDVPGNLLNSGDPAVDISNPASPPAELLSGSSALPAISRDGCHVAFVTQRPFAVLNGTDEADLERPPGYSGLSRGLDVYRYTRPGCPGVGATGRYELASLKVVDVGDGEEELQAFAFGADGNPEESQSPVALDRPAISADGRYVVYAATATALGDSDDDYDSSGTPSLFVVDMSRTDPLERAQSTRKIRDRLPSEIPDDDFPFRGSLEPTISDDGRFIAYSTDADPAADSGGRWPVRTYDGQPDRQVWLYDREADTSKPGGLATSLTLVSRNFSTGTQAPGSSSQPSISGDGRRVAYASEPKPSDPAAGIPPNLDLTSGGQPIVYDTCDDDCFDPQVFVTDLGASATRLISRTTGALPSVAGDARSLVPSITGDGRLVSYSTSARNLLSPNPPAGTGTTAGVEVLLATVPEGAGTPGSPAPMTVVRISEEPDGDPAPYSSLQSSADTFGRYIAFASNQGDALLDLPPTTDPSSGAEVPVLSGQFEVFVRQRGAAITLTPPATDFGTIDVGQVSGFRTLTVTNTGQTTVKLGSETLTGFPPFVKQAGGSCVTSGPAGSVLTPGATCTIVVFFQPTVAGTFSGTVQVATAGIAPVSASAALRAAAKNPATSAAITVTSVDFGSVTLPNTSTARDFTVRNTGQVAARITSFTFVNGNPGDFAVVAGGTCVAGTTVLPPEGSCTVRATFKPAAAGSRFTNISVLGTATITTNEGNLQTVTVSALGRATGVGVNPPPPLTFTLTLTPNPTSFGSVNLGSSTARVLTVRNTGTGSNKIGAFSRTGANPADFTITGNACTNVTLAPNGTCTVTVSFLPGAVGNRSATLTVAGQNGSSASAALTGVGVARPALQITPTPASFGQRTVGTPSTPVTLTVRNAGGAPVTISGITVAGLNFSEFTIASNGCAARTLAPNATCPVVMVFTPADAGARSAVLVATGTPAASATAQLVGTGIFAPTLVFNPGVVTPGRTTVLQGNGFPRLSPVTLNLKTGLGTQVVTANSDGTGAFRLNILVRPNTMAGTWVATAPAVAGKYPDVTATLLVGFDTFKPQNVSGPAFGQSPALITRG